ncbi:MAG: cyclic nucleotide-binding domain-containing protein [Acidimicrobiia bacterium]|nr:cyclic nucleotide-binding domain-containing protein [Acidimicrobiia bacterium]
MARIKEPQKIAALQRIPLFEDLDKKELQFLASLVTEVPVRPGTKLVKQGEIGLEAMIVEEGTADVIRDGNKVDEIGPGDFFGEMSLIHHQPRNADVVATSDMIVLDMSAREFATMLDAYPDVAMKILRTVVARLAASQEASV